MKYSLKQLLVGLLLLFSFLPFVSLYPINSDIQPVAHIMALIVLAIYTSKIRPFHMYLMFTALLLIVYVDPDGQISGISKPIAYVLGIVLFIAYQDISHVDILKVLKYVIIIYFGYCLFIIIMPHNALSFQSLLVRDVKVSSFDSLAFTFRGVPVLGTEPGLIGGHLSAMFLVLYILSRTIYVNRTYFFLLLFCIGATKSGMGYTYLALVMTYVLLDSKSYIVLILLSIGVMVAGPIILDMSETSNRGILIISVLLTGDGMMGDTSASKRIYDFAIMFPALVNYPFGVGWGDAAQVTNVLAYEYNLKPVHDIGRTIGLVSSFSSLVVAFGILFLTHLYLTLRASNCRKVIWLFPLLYLSFSFSAGYPLIWLLLAMKDPRDI